MKITIWRGVQRCGVVPQNHRKMLRPFGTQTLPHRGQRQRNTVPEFGGYNRKENEPSGVRRATTENHAGGGEGG